MLDVVQVRRLDLPRFNGRKGIVVGAGHYDKVRIRVLFPDGTTVAFAENELARIGPAISE